MKAGASVPTALTLAHGNVVPFDPVPGDPRDRAKRVAHECYELYRQLLDQARDAGLAVDHGSLVTRTYTRGLDLASVWERRAQALERTLRWVLASDRLTEAPPRADVLDVLFGRQQVSRDPKLFTKTEVAMDAETRSMVRSLVDRLANKDGAR